MKVMKITNKLHHDPATDTPQIETYMRSALIAAEEMLGRTELEVILKESGLQQFIGNYPPDELKLSSNFTVGNYTDLCVGLLQFYGDKGKDESIRFGRISTRSALEKQNKLFIMATRTALKVLPLSMQIKTILDSIKNDLDKLYKDVEHDVNVSIEDRGDKWAYVDYCCALCAGKVADEPICWSWVGTLSESLTWMTGKDFEIDQVECRAMGDKTCTWEISKTAKP